MEASVRRLRLISGALLAATLLAAVVGCSASTSSSSPVVRPSGDPGASPTMPSWQGVPLTDVNTGSQFRIADFRGKVVLVELMATWCAACRDEMNEVREVIAQLGPDADFVSVTLDTDSRDDETVLRNYAKLYGFDWRIAIAPQEVLRFLATNYDAELLNPPLQPMLLVDREGGVWGLPYGHKSAESLKLTIEKYLNQ